MTIGKYIETCLDRGVIPAYQIIVVYDSNNNIMWFGKAEFYPIYMDWVNMSSAYLTKNELLIYA